MPQPFINAVMTNKGAELLTKAQAGEAKIEFTRLVTGSGSYQEAEKTFEYLQERTGLRVLKQSFMPSSVTTVPPRSVLIKALITNHPVSGQELAEGYYINEMGLYAKEKDGDSSTEVLYSITVTTGANGDFMPPYNGYSPAEIQQEYYATVSNTAQVTIISGQGAVALADDLADTNRRVDELEGRTENITVLPFDKAERIGKEITLSWAEIKAKVEAGDFSGFNIGDWKSVITKDAAETFIMEIAGINMYTAKMAGLLPEYHIDFISRDCLQGAVPFHDRANSNENNFKDTSMYTFLNSSVFSRLPDDLQAVIMGKIVENTKDSGLTSSNLWLPTELEVYGFMCNSVLVADYGSAGYLQYPIFKLGNRYIHKGEANGVSTGEGYWLMNPNKNDTYSYCTVGQNCRPESSGASYGRSVPICFTIGKEWPEKT